MSFSTGGNSSQRELVICHGCDNEWWRDERGLECPRCHGDFVEIIDPRDDPRSEQGPSHQDGANNAATPQHPFGDLHPWRNTPADPDEEDIDHFSFSPAPGMHIQRTFVRSGGMRSAQRSASPNDDTVNSLFNALGGFLQATGQNRDERAARTRAVMFTNGQEFSPQNPFNQHPRFRTAWSTSVGGDGRNPWASEDRVPPPNMPRRNDLNDPVVGFQAMMSTMLSQLHGLQGPPPHAHGDSVRGGPTAVGLPALLAQIFNPANAVHGDAVYSQEAFDRIIEQIMEQNGGSNAPGPASSAAIAALPKRKVDKTMMGSDGKAECSVCMDNVTIGEEVTSLPCNHWFHEQCVSIWLKEHDTCPHCRKSITPAEGAPTEVRSPGQLPRYDTNPPEQPLNNPADPFTQPGMQHPYVPGGYPSYPEPHAYVQPVPSPHQLASDHLQPPPQHSNPARHSSRRSSTNSRGQSERRASSGGASGPLGWLRNLRGGGRSQD